MSSCLRPALAERTLTTMPTLGVTTNTTLAIPLGVLAVAEDLRAALLTLSTIKVEGADGTPTAYVQNADYQNQPGTPMPYRAVERALLTVLTEATGSAMHAQRILDEAHESGQSIRYATEVLLGWRIVVTDGAGDPLPTDDELTTDDEPDAQALADAEYTQR